MKKIALTFGLISGGLIIVYTVLTLFYLGAPVDMTMDKLHVAEIFGYLRYLILIITVYFAMRTYKQQTQAPTYWKLVKAGIVVSIVVGVLVGLMELIYVALNPEFFDAYQAAYLQGLQHKGASAAEIADFKSMMESLAWIRSPLATGFFYCAQMVVLGAVVALIIGIFMRRKSKPQLASV